MLGQGTVLAGCIALLVGLAGCATQKRAGPGAIVAPAKGQTASAPKVTPPVARQQWTYSIRLQSLLPVSPEELDDLQADSLYSVSVHGRRVWIGAHGESGRAQLEQVRGPISITLGDLSPTLLARIEELAKHYPVAISYERPLSRDLPGGAKRAGAPPPDESGLGSLHHVQAMVLGADVGPDFPDLRACTGLRVLETFRGEPQRDLYERLPVGLEELLASSIATSGSPQALLRLRNLRRLELSNSREFTLADLAPLTELEDLDMGDTLTDSDLAHLRAFPKLRRLVTASPLTNAAIPHLAKVPRLESLSIRESHINAAGVDELVKLSQLQDLEPPRSLSADSIAKLAALRNLRRLYLYASKLNDQAMSSLSALPNLEALECPLSQLTDASAPSIAKLHTLRRLDLSDSKVGDKTARALERLTHLRRLKLSITQITSAAVPALLKLTELRELHVNVTPLDRSGILALLELPNLRRYYVTTDVSDLETRSRIQHTQRLFDFYQTTCSSERIRLPGRDCDDE